VLRTGCDGNFITINSAGCGVSENKEASIMTAYDRSCTDANAALLSRQANRAFTDGLPNLNENSPSSHQMLILSALKNRFSILRVRFSKQNIRQNLKERSKHHAWKSCNDFVKSKHLVKCRSENNFVLD